jgi:hypothetical protein
MHILTKKGYLLELFKKPPSDAQCVAKTDMGKNLHFICIEQCCLSCFCDSSELYLCDQILGSY